MWKYDAKSAPYKIRLLPVRAGCESLKLKSGYDLLRIRGGKEVNLLDKLG